MGIPLIYIFVFNQQCMQLAQFTAHHQFKKFCIVLHELPLMLIWKVLGLERYFGAGIWISLNEAHSLCLMLVSSGPHSTTFFV